MWFIGLIVGAILGAGMRGFYGAMWGAMLGWLIALVLGRNSDASKRGASEDKFIGLDKRVTYTQKSLEDIHWRLSRLEEIAGLPESPMAAANALDTKNVVARATDDANIAPAPVLAVQLPEPASIAPASHEVPITKISTATKPAEAAGPSAPTVVAPGIIERLLEGNIVAKLGVVILFFGVGFLLKFAYDRGVFPPQMRLLGVAVASAVMFFLGLRLLQKQRTYALILFGGAMGLLYLDVFFALKTFALISAPAGFVLFAVLGITTIVLAVRLDARAFAALGLLGAFMAPILASTGSGNHVLLFSYYLLLNLVILGASWFKAWRELNFIGFLFTFAIALIWGYASYQLEHFSTVEPFLIAFFILYLAIPILFAHRQPPQLKGLMDGTLIFGMPLSAAILQAALTRGLGDQTLAWNALSVALVYACLAWTLWKREKMRLLAEAHLALALVFGTVSPYFAFHGYPTFAFWTLEGAAIFWMGCRQQSIFMRAFALCLQIGAAAYFWSLTHVASYIDPWSNDREVGYALIAAASLLTAWFMHRFEDIISKAEAATQLFMIAWGCLWWFAALHGIIESHATPMNTVALHLAAVALSILIFEMVGQKFVWPAMRRTQVLLPLAMLLAAVYLADHEVNPFMGTQLFAWVLAFVIAEVMLARQERDGNVWEPALQHVVLFNLALLLLTWEVCWRAQDAALADAWRYAGVALIFVLGLIVVTFGIAKNRWPFSTHAAAFRSRTLITLLIASLLWTLIANVDSGEVIGSLPYLPILNPLDLAQLALFATAAWAMRDAFEKAQTESAGTQGLLLFAAANFFWVNAALLRTVHHWADVPFELCALLHSVVAQAALSLLWTSTALVMMFAAGKRLPPSRALWMAGAALLGAVLVKLFLNDLGNTGTVARIVSFIGVGVLLLVIGYVAPVPPKVRESMQ